MLENQRGFEFMLRWVTQLRGRRTEGRDGEIGEIRDMLFDDGSWVIRYLVADTGDWLSGQLVLLASASLRSPGSAESAFRVYVTKDQIEKSPPINIDRPVPWRKELDVAEHFGWPVYWGKPLGFGSPQLIAPEEAHVETAEKPVVRERGISDDAVDPHLRSMRELCGYQVRATDKQIGHVEDFFVEDSDWTVRYVVVDTKNWLPRHRVLLAPSGFDRIRWDKSEVYLSLDSELINNSPEYDPSSPIDRDYERRIRDHYGRDVPRK